MKMSTLLRVTGALAVSALALTAADHAAAQAKKIKIGFVTTLSGPNAAYGIDMRNSFELALDHMGRKMGGIPVEVIYEDDEQKPEVGKQKTDKLLQRDRVDFMAGYIWSNVLLASYKPVVDSKTFLISANAGPSQLAGEQCNPYFFAASWANEQNPMGVGHLLNQKNVKRLYIVAPNYAAGQDMANGVKATFKGEVVGQDMTRWPDQLDFSAEISKIRATKPDAVYIFFPGRAGVQFYTQYSQANLKKEIPLYSVFTVDGVTLKLQKDLVLDTYFGLFWAPDLPYAANQKFVTDYKKKHKDTPTFYGAQSYDVANLIASAVAATKGNLKDKEGLRKALEAANFDSVRGPMKFNKNHFPIHAIYQQEAYKVSENEYDIRTISKIIDNLEDPSAPKCKM
ncbi:ABC transporter substrate-binding protein [uncultured Ferrovibrio sp.]|mgnify:CR=1 FL=1|jgi:branched-chain amino acid transport system substrate-binding protein|uniref:ABC transporter substrate-binding protein n=1 Tax=uncultured Ferrovibrio sp. TaxID=1576913 RepID=UPI002621E556|nr:ABC transporter substrate-binding protein [uncultured Ferrovibrio sp.]